MCLKVVCKSFDSDPACSTVNAIKALLDQRKQLKFMIILLRTDCGPKEKLTMPQGERPGLADLCPLSKGISVNLGNDWWESWDTVL